MTRERIQECIVEEIIDVSVPQVMKETIEVAKHTPQKQGTDH